MIPVGITDRHRLKVRDDAGGRYQAMGASDPVVDGTEILTTFRAATSLTIWPVEAGSLTPWLR